MKHFLSVIFSMLLALTLAACTTTTMDPAVGKMDYQTYIKWFKSVDAESKLEEELSKVDRKSVAEESSLLNSIIEKSFNDVIASGKALNLRHEEVRKLRDITVEMLNAYKQAVPAYLLQTDDNLVKAEAAKNKLAQLVKEGTPLMDKLDIQFGE